MKKLICFVPNMSALANIRKMILDIQSYKKNDKKILIFIDFKSAFNSIKRSLLYEILEKKQILENDEIEFIKSLHSHIHYKSKDKIFYYMNRVPQGYMLSPALFNIYFEEFLDEIQSKYRYMTIYAYADDVAFLINDSDIPNFINTLQDVSCKYCLSINKSKSGIMYLHDKIRTSNKQNIQNTSHMTDQPELFENHPVINEYTYFRIRINNCGKIIPHTGKFKITVEYIANKIKWTANKCSLRKQILLWKCYIRLYFLYVMPIMDRIRKTSNKLYLDYGNTRLNKYTISPKLLQVIIYTNSLMIQINGTNKQLLENLIQAMDFL